VVYIFLASLVLWGVVAAASLGWTLNGAWLWGLWSWLRVAKILIKLRESQ